MIMMLSTRQGSGVEIDALFGSLALSRSFAMGCRDEEFSRLPSILTSADIGIDDSQCFPAEFMKAIGRRPETTAADYEPHRRAL